MLRSAERLLEARGFALVLLDLVEARVGAVPGSAWPRLVRAAAASRTSLVVLGAQRLAGAFAAQSLELDPARARFSGTPVLLEGLEGRLLLVRNRLGPAQRVAAFRLPSCAA
jgi:hypothetical protein